MNDSNLFPSNSLKEPRTAETIKQMLQEVGIRSFEPQVVVQIADLAYSLTKEILSEAQTTSEFASKKQIDKDDIVFTINAFQEKHKSLRPSKSLLSKFAAEKNSQPLQPFRQNFGLRLPNDRFCQVQPNFEYVDVDVNDTAIRQTNDDSVVYSNDYYQHQSQQQFWNGNGDGAGMMVQPPGSFNTESVTNMLDRVGGVHSSGISMVQSITAYNSQSTAMEEDFD